MQKILLETPFGQEILYQPTLDAVIELLAERLSSSFARYASHPAVARLVEKMLPTAKAQWDTFTARGMAYLEITPDALTGFGVAVPLRDLPDLPPLSAPMDCWGLAMAMAEGLRRGMKDPDGAAVFPLYVENALHLAVDDIRVTVGLSRVAVG